LFENETKLLFIFAGSTKIEALQQKQFLFLLDNAKSIKISFLDRDAAYRLITAPVKGTIGFEEGVTDYIQELCSGHAFYTQALCQSIFEMVHGRGTVTKEHVEQAVRKFLENPAPHLILTWNALEIEKRVVLSALAAQEARTDLPDANPFIAASEIESFLQRENYPFRFQRTEIQERLSPLREEDWITKEEGNQRYRFALRLVQRWVGEYRSIWDVLSEHRKSVAGSLAGAWRRVFVASLDLVFLAILFSALIACWVAMWEYPQHWISLLPLLYYGTSMRWFNSTPGMHILGTRVMSESGGRLSLGRKLCFAGLRSLPIFLLINAGLFVGKDQIGWGWACGALAILWAGCHCALTLFSKSGRGLYDKLVRAMIVRSPREQK
jgi:uncharacterized RDD family membrane protein YckC